MNSWLEVETPATIRGDVEESKQTLRDVLHRLELIAKTDECLARVEQVLAAIERLRWTLERRFGGEDIPPPIPAVLDRLEPRPPKVKAGSEADAPRLFVAAPRAKACRR